MIDEKGNPANSDEDIVKEIRKENIDVIAIYAFGSIVRGNATPKSDYDIAIFVKKYPRNDLAIIFNLDKSLSMKLKRPVDIIILEPADLEQSPVFLYELYNNNKKLFGLDVLKKYRSAVQEMKPDRPLVKSGPVWYNA